MISHAKESFPNECCSLLGGNNFIYTTYYPLANISETPEKNYFAAPEELFRVFKEMRKFDQKLLGIYHSHPKSIAYPSNVDIKSAFYSEAVYFIYSLQEQNLAAFHIEQENVISIDFEVI